MRSCLRDARGVTKGVACLLRSLLKAMGRKRRGDALESPKKKHKKNKRKKNTAREDDDIESSEIECVSNQRPIKLKIKLGDQLISSTSATLDSPLVMRGDDASSVAESESHSLVGGNSGSSIGGGVSLDAVEGSSLGNGEEELPGSDISVGKDDFAGSGEEEEEGEEVEEEEEEEAWLDALEAGEVNERGYLPQKTSSGSLTARQRAMMGSDGGRELLELPIGRSVEDPTEEMLLKKTEKDRKRRLAAQRRKEKRKAETVRKLLEKQSTKKKEDEKTRVPKKPGVPHLRYSTRLAENGAIESTLSLPPGMELPTEKSHVPPPLPVLCAVEGCQQPKKYSDSLTKLPLCSLTCYKVLHSKNTLQQIVNNNSNSSNNSNNNFDSNWLTCV